MPTQVRLLPEPRDLDGGFGIEVEPERLVEIMLELQAQGAHNINLVTATHFAHLLPDAIAEARSQGLSIPIVYNTSGYEREEAVAELGDLVDIWLVDYKYADASLGRALSHVPDYPEVASRALKRMCAEVARRGESSFVRMASWSAASSSAISCFPAARPTRARSSIGSGKSPGMYPSRDEPVHPE